MLHAHAEQAGEQGMSDQVPSAWHAWRCMAILHAAKAVTYLQQHLPRELNVYKVRL